MEPTAVYLMRNIWSEANYKVGVSSIPHRRVWQVEEAYGVGPMIVSTVWFPTRYSATKAEGLWHKYLKEYQTDDHGGREWFCLPDHIVSEFVEWAKLSPDGTMLKLKVKAQRLSKAEVRQLSTTLLRSIPHEQHFSPGGNP
jgi:T5orf172 domain